MPVRHHPSGAAETFRTAGAAIAERHAGGIDRLAGLGAGFSLLCGANRPLAPRVIYRFMAGDGIE